jgi:hypothetical protein
VKTPERAARLLVRGILPRQLWPELRDDEFRADVVRRLEGVGLELAAGDGYWVARACDGEGDDSFEPIFSLNEPELAVLAALYLHLSFLPRHGAYEGDERPSVEVTEIENTFPGYPATYVRGVLAMLKNARFVYQQNHRLYAGPYLAALETVIADERAGAAIQDGLLRKFLQRFLNGDEELPAELRQALERTQARAAASEAARPAAEEETDAAD